MIKSRRGKLVGFICLKFKKLRGYYVRLDKGLILCNTAWKFVEIIESKKNNKYINGRKEKGYGI